MWYERSENYRPFFWLGGRPIYANTLVFLFHLVAFVGALLAASVLSIGNVYLALVMNTEQVWAGQVWRLLSYVIFVPTSAGMALSFIFAMGTLYHFGQQVDEFVGRTVYLRLYAALVLIPALLLVLLGLWQPQFNGNGMIATIFGVFVAFATIYPGVTIPIWFTNLSAVLWAWSLLAVLTLANLATHDYVSVGLLWVDAAIGFVAMRVIGAGRGLDGWFDWWEARRNRRLARQHNIRIVKERTQTESIDSILEKISRHGMASLSREERAALEQARAVLMSRDKR